MESTWNSPWNPCGMYHSMSIPCPFHVDPWWGWNEKMAEDSPKSVPYGIHGMDGGIHPFHMEYTGECKDLLDVTHACCFCNACAQAIVYHCYLIRWKILLCIQLFQFYVSMFQVAIKLTVSNLNNYLTQHFYEVVDDILFILDVPKLYHSFPPHSTNHNYPHNTMNRETSSYSQKL